MANEQNIQEDKPVRDYSNMVNFSALNRLILRDLTQTQKNQTFYKYTKSELLEFLKNPQKNEKKLRDSVIYLYSASSHFRRLIQYFVGLSDLSYIISPYKLDTKTAKADTLKKQYQRTLNLLSTMDIKVQGAKILTVCLREDTFYGTMWVTNDNITIQQLPSDYCTISTIEGNVCNTSFNFSYFDSNKEFLPLYPNEFNTKYNAYLKDKKLKWQELDSPNSFAIKCNSDILGYSVPPFSGILPEIYDIQDYKDLKMVGTELENYCMLVMQLLMGDNGEYQIPLEEAKQFYKQLDNVLPEQIGSVLSPMKLDKIDFGKNNQTDSDKITEAESALFSAAGVSSLIFNNEKASGNALNQSIKSDQAITYGIVKNIECMINRFLQNQSFSKNFRITFLDCSPYNRKELSDDYLKACQNGTPMISLYCASMGISQSDIEGLNFLEQDVLDLASKFKPLQTSYTQSSGEVGKPTNESKNEPLEESGQQTEDNESNAKR